ncbi:MAG: NADH-quinone oxidoreductase subunit J [Terriglobia bacterium]
MDLFFFMVFALIALACALNVVLQKQPISSALSLVGVMSSLAVLYLLLGADFLAMAQIIVYAGAIMVLFIFVIMLLNAGAEETRGRSWISQILGVPALLILMGALCFFAMRWFPNAGFVKFGDFAGGGPQQLGYALFTDYLLPFEVTSVLILIAIIGAIVLARKELD